MQKENVKKYAILMAITGILLMMTGVGYALFTYFGLGNTTISISSNGVIFSYNEGKQGISLTESMPLTDIQGMAQSEYFEFNIKAKTESSEIPYYITARKTSNSSDIDEAIKLYLTKVDKNGNEEGVALVKFSDLKQYTNSGIDLSKYVEKLLYNTRVASNQVNYHQTYRLRIWIDYDTDFTNTKYQNANFGLTINVYGTAKNSDIYAKANGRLHVTGSKLMNQNNEEFRITGVSNMATPFSSYATYLSTHEKMYSVKSLTNLKNWGVNGFRIFCSKSFWETATEEEYNNTMNALKEVIDKLINLDMYVMVNWSTGSDPANNPPQTEAAKRFFGDITSYYQNDYHILYEIWNEPTDINTWSQISAHANQVIPVIRANAPDSIILVGTPNFDQRVDQVIGHELPYDNIMYTHHTYTNNVTDKHMLYLKKAVDAGLPIFETECSAVPTGSPKGDFTEDSAAYTLFNYLENNNISYMYFGYDIGAWAYNFMDISKYEWDENLPEIQLRQNALYLKKLLKGSNTIGYMLKENVNDTSVGGNDYRSAEWKDKIVSIEFKNKINIPSNVIKQWDLSIVGDKSIIGYLIPTNEEDRYSMIIAANGRINAPRDSRYLFAGMKNLKSIDFTNFETIGVIHIGGIFQYDEALESLDLSGFDTSKIVKMNNAFAFCYNLKSINFAGWNPNLSSIDTAFRDCRKLETLDLSGFNVKSVTTFKVLFYNCYSLKTLNISTWNPDKITDISKILMNTNSLEEVNMSSMINLSNDTVVTQALQGVKTNARIIVNNQAIIDLLTPTSTNAVTFEISN